MSEKNRIAHYDILRGIAISIMVMANSVASIYTTIPPLFMRLMGSFAAPCFMLLAGMVLALSQKNQPVRGLYILAFGCLVDVGIWHIMPFMTFDVLYTIGVAIIITAYPARFFSIKTLLMIGILFILTGQGLRWMLGYHHDVLEIALPLQSPLPPIIPLLSGILHQLFIDGWFPLFPWLGFVWLGAALQRGLQAQSAPHDQSPLIPKKWLLYFIVLLVIAGTYWAFSLVVPEPRMGYSELFYPADIGFCFTVVSAFCVLLFFIQEIVRWRPIRVILTPLKWMGQRSLWIYVFHLIIIQYVLHPYFTTANLSQFLCIAGILWIGCVLIARALITYSVIRAKNSLAHLPYSRSE